MQTRERAHCARSVFPFIKKKKKKKLGEVRPRVIQQGSVSRYADRHHLREDLSSRLLDCQIPRSCRQVLLPSPPARMWHKLLGHMASLTALLCSPGSWSDAPSSLAAEGLLVSSCGRSLNAITSDSGLRGLSLLVTGRGRGGTP